MNSGSNAKNSFSYSLELFMEDLWNTVIYLSSKEVPDKEERKEDFVRCFSRQGNLI